MIIRLVRHVSFTDQCVYYVWNIHPIQYERNHRIGGTVLTNEWQQCQAASA